MVPLFCLFSDNLCVCSNDPDTGVLRNILLEQRQRANRWCTLSGNQLFTKHLHGPRWKPLCRLVPCRIPAWRLLFERVSSIERYYGRLLRHSTTFPCFPIQLRPFHALADSDAQLLHRHDYNGKAWFNKPPNAHLLIRGTDRRDRVRERRG